MDLKTNLFAKHVFSTDFQKEFKQYWHAQCDFKNKNLEIISKPFKICKISNFIKSKYYLKSLVDELSALKHKSVSLDLYQYSRANLVNATGENIQILYRSFKKHLVSWMKNNTNIKLTKKMSMASSCYSDTDFLLCHDDNIGDRRIAYILYLTEDWSEEYGGSLDLFNTDEHGAPKDIVRSLVPEFNSLVFFEVVENSYHQVAEVVADKPICRWSINGWFHGPLKEDYHKPSVYESPKKYIEPNTTKENLNLWISKTYLLSNNIKHIQSTIEKMSYALLTNFLKNSIYQKIMTNLKSEDISWRMVGPANLNRYEIADEQTLPKVLKEFCNLFKSISFFELLKQYTELDLVPDNRTMKPKMTIELQRWSTGCYTLLHDKMILNSESDAEVSSSTNSNSIESPVASTSKSLTSNDETSLDVIKTKQLKRKNPNSTAEVRSNKKKVRFLIDDEIDERLSSKNVHDEDEINVGTSKTNEELQKKMVKSTCPAKISYRRQPVDSQCQSNAKTKSPSKKHDVGKISLLKKKSSVAIQDKASSDTASNTTSDKNESLSSNEEFKLDLIMQFHTVDDKGEPKTDSTIDYINPEDKDGVIIQIPQEDNHLCLVYRIVTINRLHTYLNHYFKGYCYNLICTYCE